MRGWNLISGLLSAALLWHGPHFPATRHALRLGGTCEVSARTRSRTVVTLIFSSESHLPAHLHTTVTTGPTRQ